MTNLNTRQTFQTDLSHLAVKKQGRTVKPDPARSYKINFMFT